jgi:hypothetical protein
LEYVYNCDYILNDKKEVTVKNLCAILVTGTNNLEERDI